MDIPFVGGMLCLDFANTAYLQDGETVDWLEEYDTFEEWLAAADEAGALPPGIDAYVDYRSFPELIALRDAIRLGAERLAMGKELPKSVLETVNESLKLGEAHSELVRKNGRIQRNVVFGDEPSLQFSIAESAAVLFAECDPKLVKICSAADCVLAFYDTTKNHKRRWCSMETCGNRAKVKAHQSRSRGE